MAEFCPNPSATAGTNPPLSSDETSAARSQSNKRQALVIHRDVSSHDDQETARRKIGPHILPALKAMGIDATDVIFGEPSSGHSMRRCSLPRNIRWKNFPLIQRPMFEDQMFCFRRFTGTDPANELEWFQEPFTVQRESRRSLIDGCQVVVIDEASVSTTIGREVLSLWDDHPNPPAFRLLGQYGLELLPGDLLADIRRLHEPGERFVWNYGLNFTTLCARAYYRMAREWNVSRSIYSVWGPRPDDAARQWNIGHPMGIQILYLLRRECGGVTLPDIGGDIDKTVLRDAIVNGTSFLHPSKDGRHCIFRWAGSGRYPAWEMPLFPNPLLSNGNVYDYWETPSILKGIHYVVERLFKQGLVTITHDGRLQISRGGLRFLELIGPELEDPDMVLRWRIGDVWGAPEMVPAMDRWLNRKFRAVKRRVAHLPASPFVEPEAEWDDIPHKCLTVVGRYAVLGDDDRTNPEIVSAVEEIERSSEGTPWPDRRCGVMRDNLRLASDGKPILLWVGVPIGAFDGQAAAETPMVPVPDLALMETQLEMAMAHLPAVLRERLGHSTGLWVVDLLHWHESEWSGYVPKITASYEGPRMQIGFAEGTEAARDLYPRPRRRE